MDRQWLQYFGHLMQRPDSLEKTPMLGKTEGRRRGRHRRRWLDGITDSAHVSLSKPREMVKDRGVHGVAKSRTQLSDWTTTGAGSASGAMVRPGGQALPHKYAWTSVNTGPHPRAAHCLPPAYWPLPSSPSSQPWHTQVAAHPPSTRPSPCGLENTRTHPVDNRV